MVSIHALLAECDTMNTQINLKDGVSIHALLAECDINRASSTICLPVSIHALLAECDEKRTKTNEKDYCFNPRTPCGVRLSRAFLAFPYSMFQSTHSLRSATLHTASAPSRHQVSIHALLAECDNGPSEIPNMQTGFNPRTPCGVRRNRLYTLLLNRANHTLRQPP